MYNKVKPVSSESQIFKQIQELPIIDFPVEQHGSMFQSNLKVNVKQKAFFESASGKNIARMMIKVNAQSLGNISISFKDVLLENSSYCLVYTQDHQIVAGPIYQKSISNNQFTIMNIPASELILEVIYKDKNDFTMLLDEVGFESLLNLNELKKKKQQEQFLGGLYGLNFIDNVVFDSYKSCTSGKYYPFGCLYTGHPSINDHKSLQKLYSANDSIFVDFNSTRSRAVLMVKQFNCDANDTTNESFRFRTTNATLINFPYINCDSSFITVSKHEYPYNDVRNNINNIADNSIVRFNLHYKYGTPYHLWNVNCESSISNFNKWRETIDFNEVVDYQGVEVVAYKSDFDILLIKEKLIFKENHIGWTTQDKYDIFQENTQDGLNFYYPDEVQENIYILASRGGYSPTSYFDKFKVLPGNQVVSLESNYPDGFSGYSGSVIFKNKLYGFDDQFFYSQIYNVSSYENDYEMFLGNHIYTIIKSKMDFCNFCDTTNILRNYWNNNNLFFYTDTISYNFYNYHDSTLIGSSNELINYLPSMNNKEKCPSPVEPENPCDFDINDYITYSVTNGEVCITINEIPDDKFPDPDNLPKGYRIYHNYGEQKTEAWQSFQGGNDISFPIQFCIDKCRLAYLLSLGKDKAKIGIDFYDVNGNVYNNPGCDTLEFDFDINLCNLVDVSAELIENIGTCCTYEISVNMSVLEGCEDFNPGTEILEDLMSSSIKFRGYNDTNYLPIQTQQMYNYNAGTKTHTFRYQVCDPSDTLASNFIISFDADSISCETEPIDFPACLCDCPVDIDSWVTLSSVAKEPPCSVLECHVSGEFSINIPSIYNCYTRFSVNDSTMHPITNSNGSIPAIHFDDCIKQGTEKEYTFKFFKDVNDTTPCEVTKTVGCLYEDFTQPCTPDCDTVKWDIRYLDPLDLPGCHGCKARIKYASRKNTCLGTQDIQILAMTQYTDGPDSLACQNCMISSAEMYKEAMLKIIYDNEMDFLPRTPSDTCDNTWRVVNGACWAIKFYNTGENPPNWWEWFKKLHIVWLPCDDTECCAMNLRVCRSDIPPPEHITVDTLGYSGGGDSCSTLEKIVWIPHLDDYDTLQCNEACFWITQVTSEGYFGKQIFMIENEIEEFINTEKLSAKMTQYENLLDFDLLSEFESDDVKISIHSLQGQSIIENYYTLKKGKNHYHFHIDKLQSGFYFITIQIDGSVQKTEKIIIVR